MEPVVYDFAINEQGTSPNFSAAIEALLPPGYYAFTGSRLLRIGSALASRRSRRVELDTLQRRLPDRDASLPGWSKRFSRDCCRRQSSSRRRKAQTLPRAARRMGLRSASSTSRSAATLERGRIGLAQIALPSSHDDPGCRSRATCSTPPGQSTPVSAIAGWRRLPRRSRGGNARCGGAGSRWTQGAGVVKALHPFCKFDGTHRTFIETASGQEPAHQPALPATRCRTSSPPVTSPMTRSRSISQRRGNYGYPGPVVLRQAARSACAWCPRSATSSSHGRRCRSSSSMTAAESAGKPARGPDPLGAAAGEATTTTDNVPLQCLHPGRPLVRDAEPPAQWRACRPPRGASASSATCCCTTSIPSGRSRSRRSSAAHSTSAAASPSR